MLKPFDPVQLFAAVDRALERRRGGIERQRLTWELRLLNEVAAAVNVTTDVGEALRNGRERMADAYDARWAILRLRPLDGGALVVHSAVGGSV